MDLHLPDGEQMFIYDASVKYQKEGVPLLIIAGKEYGSGSSRDWAAKGVMLLGVKAVIAESFERIHRTNLVGMGVLPLQFAPGETAASAGADGQRCSSVRRREALSRRAGEGDGRPRCDDGRREDFDRARAWIHRRKRNTSAMAEFCRLYCGRLRERRSARKYQRSTLRKLRRKCQNVRNIDRLSSSERLARSRACS